MHVEPEFIRQWEASQEAVDSALSMERLHGFAVDAYESRCREWRFRLERDQRELERLRNLTP